MNERFIYLSNRIIDELNKIDLATQRAFNAWQDFQNSGNEFFLANNPAGKPGRVGPAHRHLRKSLKPSDYQPFQISLLTEFSYACQKSC